jgi:hypothetical protein
MASTPVKKTAAKTTQPVGKTVSTLPVYVPPVLKQTATPQPAATPAPTIPPGYIQIHDPDTGQTKLVKAPTTSVTTPKVVTPRPTPALPNPVTSTPLKVAAAKAAGLTAPTPEEVTLPTGWQPSGAPDPNSQYNYFSALYKLYGANVPAGILDPASLSAYQSWMASGMPAKPAAAPVTSHPIDTSNKENYLKPAELRQKPIGWDPNPKQTGEVKPNTPSWLKPVTTVPNAPSLPTTPTTTIPTTTVPTTTVPTTTVPTSPLGGMSAKEKNLAYLTSWRIK